ncbi:hypothetical protein Cadr_000001836 [Camelus dromedarius]|uniref:Uncharacterized protein n=1 Tax=Camelus dromedarius TaxID=9838 RepID=A0A5N4EGN0_CAMDR|nr:hypothetical protein Cadr_000001836 [Camelus dromedarius]
MGVGLSTKTSLQFLDFSTTSQFQCSSICTTTAAAIASAASTSETTSIASSTMAPSTLQPEATTNAQRHSPQLPISNNRFHKFYNFYAYKCIKSQEDKGKTKINNTFQSIF